MNETVMSYDKDGVILRLRIHHICCLPHMELSFEERSAGFNQVVDRVKSIMLSQPDSVVTVIEGTDDICRQCPLFVNGRCSSTQGDEDAVRKWDSILMKELVIPFGTTRTADEWQALIRQKAPFKICRKCQWQPICRLGRDLS